MEPSNTTTTTPPPITTSTVIFGLAELYGYELKDSSAVLYLDCLEDFTLEEVRAAARSWMRQSKWMPKPAELIAIIRERRSEGTRHEKSAETIGAATQKPLRSQFRVPAGLSIMEHIESLRASGLSPDEIASEMCGGEDPENAPRYRCLDCRDTRFVRVWHPRAMRAALDRREVPRLSCSLPCSCEAGRKVLEQNPKMRIGYDETRMVIASGSWIEDEARLEEWAAKRFAAKRDPVLAQFSGAAQGGGW